MRIFGDDDEELRRRYSRRALLLGLGQIAAFGALGGRLYQIQVLDASRYAPLADDNRIAIKTLGPVRGRILDRNGIVLADNVESFRVALTPALAGDVKGALAFLSRIVPLSGEAQEQIVAKARRAGRGTSIIVASDVSFDQVAEINLLAPQIPGIETEIAYSRRYHHGAGMAHVTGYVGGVEKRALDDDPTLRVPGMKIGKSGLERGMDGDLRGASGERKSEVDARGRTIRHFEETRPANGIDVITTIDTQLQKLVMDRLGRERRAAAVVLDVATGDVLAMASAPTFNAQDAASPATAAAWRSLAEAENQPLVNRAINGLYPPGSTFKLVTALAGLEAGVLDLKERIPCSGSVTLADQTYRCWKRHGHISSDFHKAVRESCDVYFYEIAKRAGISAIAAMARRLGFGEPQALGLPPDKTGVVPDADWKRWNLGQGWSQGDSLLAGIGQGFVLATPMQLAVMTARIATGKAVRPVLGRPAGIIASTDFPPLGIDTRRLDAVRAAMVGVVNESGGTGAAARPDGSNVVVAGKTGTSQVRRLADDEEEIEVAWENRDHALFVSYFPAEAPRFAIAAVVEHGGNGGAIAGPLVKDIIELLIADDPLARPATRPGERSGKAALGPISIGEEG